MEDNEQSRIQPSKRVLHITFWGMHVAVIIIALLALFDVTQMSTWVETSAALAIIVFSLWYIFAIGRYASQLGRSGLVWGGLSFLLAPLGIWGSYIASFFVGHKHP